MRKISLLTLAFIAGLTVNAQHNKAHKSIRTEREVAPRIGFRAGVNLATLEVDDDYNATNYNTNSKTSFHAGAFINIPISSVFRIQPEINYVGQGSKVTGNFVSNPMNEGQYELSFHYVAVPMMFQLQSNSGLLLEAGPQAALLLKGQEDQENANVDLKDKALVKKFDFAAVAGIGYLSPIGLGINARYVHGFSNVFDSEGAPAEISAREIRNRGVQIGLVYRFGYSQ